MFSIKRFFDKKERRVTRNLPQRNVEYFKSVRAAHQNGYIMTKEAAKLLNCSTSYISRMGRLGKVKRIPVEGTKGSIAHKKDDLLQLQKRGYGGYGFVDENKRVSMIIKKERERINKSLYNHGDWMDSKDAAEYVGISRDLLYYRIVKARIWEIETKKIDASTGVHGIKLLYKINDLEKYLPVSKQKEVPLDNQLTSKGKPARIIMSGKFSIKLEHNNGVVQCYSKDLPVPDYSDSLPGFLKKLGISIDQLKEVVRRWEVT